MYEKVINTKEFFSKGTFIIPNYQRGYKWGIPDREGNDAVGILTDNLIEAFNNKQEEYFIQGVTVYEKNGKIILVDGQQRTTTFYLLLKYLGYSKLPKIEYSIRKESDYVLNECKVENGKLLFDIPKEKKEENYDLQDIFYFKQAIKTFSEKLQNSEKINFINFILEKVKLFYITINKDDATKIFSMMNTNKAFMKTDELIKAKLLSEVSKQRIKENNVEKSLGEALKEIISQEWEKTHLREKYAREWDKWLYWWNREDIRIFWNSGNNPMGLLLEYYFYKKTNDYKNYSQNEKDTHTTYKKFVNKIINNSENVNPKNIFLELRSLQKKFEDWYNNYETYNYWGLILKTSNLKKDALLFFLDNNENNKISLEEYAKWALVGTKHKQIIPDNSKKDEETKEDNAYKFYKKLNDDYIFQQNHDVAYKWLLYLNIKEDIKLKRKFDFFIWNNKSLEHIYPKSKVYHKGENEKLYDGSDNILNKDKLKSLNDETWINRDDIKNESSEHCIGNLVLLYGSNNSEFGNKPFNEKKKTYFDLKEDFKSRHLLHTISVFAYEKWGANEIRENKSNVIKEFESYYNIKRT